MHTCKESREAMIEAARQGWISMPDEIADCARCREEFDVLRGTLRMTDQALQLMQPRENFWVGYDARLRQRLIHNEQPARRSRVVVFRSALRGIATASVPVPVPLALAIFGLVFSTFVLLHSRTASVSAPAGTEPTVVTRTIEVPVIQEKQVTRIVYRNRRGTVRAAIRRDLAALGAGRNESGAAESLAGFKPAPEARVTLIKGSRDEK